MIAVVRGVPSSITACELTHIARNQIDVARARAQHARYARALEHCGCTLVHLPITNEMPDSVFIEDTAVVLPDVAVITRPGAASRRGETAAVEDALRTRLPVARVEAPATLDGGDVLRSGATLYVGRSSRSNDDGIAALAAIAAPHGFRVVPVEFEGCLHLKSAATEVADDVLLLNPAFVDAAAFAGCAIMEVHADEPSAANALRVGGAVIFSASHPLTRDRLEREGIQVVTVEVDELEKAEAGVTCCSLLV